MTLNGFDIVKKRSLGRTVLTAIVRYQNQSSQHALKILRDKNNIKAPDRNKHMYVQQ